MLRTKTIILLLSAFLLCGECEAAFPINSHTAITETVAEISSEQLTSYASIKKVHPAYAPLPYNGQKGKSHLLAMLSCFFLGWLGVHNFYLGYYGAGIAQLLISALVVYIIATATGFISLLLALPLMLGLGVWLLVEFIMICAKEKLPKNGEYD